MTEITILSKPSCVQCTATYREATKLGIPFTIVDMSEDPEALDLAKSLGHLQAPVVITPDGSWAGFRPDKLAEYASRV